MLQILTFYIFKQYNFIVNNLYRIKHESCPEYFDRSVIIRVLVWFSQAQQFSHTTITENIRPLTSLWPIGSLQHKQFNRYHAGHVTRIYTQTTLSWTKDNASLHQPKFIFHCQSPSAAGFVVFNLRKFSLLFAQKNCPKFTIIAALLVGWGTQHKLSFDEHEESARRKQHKRI